MINMQFLAHIRKVEAADKLARKESRSGRRLTRFTDSEVSFMISTEGQYTAEELREKLPHHPVNSIRDKAYRLDLTLKFIRDVHKSQEVTHDQSA